MNITFKEITKDNWSECVHLRVHDNQKHFVKSNYYSLTQSHYEDSLIARAIYNGDTMVGFIMYEVFEDKKEGWLCRFMLDKKFQEKGYGKAALVKVISLLENSFNCKEIGFCDSTHNYGFKVIYESLGFKSTGEFLDDKEIIIRKSTIII